jgi:hypothetical protein
MLIINHLVPCTLISDIELGNIDNQSGSVPNSASPSTNTNPAPTGIDSTHPTPSGLNLDLATSVVENPFTDPPSVELESEPNSDCEIVVISQAAHIGFSTHIEPLNTGPDGRNICK